MQTCASRFNRSILVEGKKKKNESVELDEYRGEYDPEYEHEMEAHDAVKRAENKKGKPLTKAERKHHEDKAYHDIVILSILRFKFGFSIN